MKIVDQKTKKFVGKCLVLRSKVSFFVDEVRAAVFTKCISCLSSQLVDGHTLFDYDIGLNDTIQLMIRAAPIAKEPVVSEKPSEKTEDADKDSEGKPESGFGSESSDTEISNQSPAETNTEVASSTEPSTSQPKGLFKVGIALQLGLGLGLGLGVWCLIRSGGSVWILWGASMLLYHIKSGLLWFDLNIDKSLCSTSHQNIITLMTNNTQSKMYWFIINHQNLFLPLPFTDRCVIL